MKRIKKRSQKTGLPPGSLVFVGDRAKTEVSIDLMQYDHREFVEMPLSVEECAGYKETAGVAWINIDAVHDPTVPERIGVDFGIHSLTLEDVLNTDQRPKMEDFESYLYIVLKMMRYDAREGEVMSEQVSLILGASYVLSFQEGIAGDVFDAVRERIRTGKGRIRALGADYLCYCLIDSVVDNYFNILEIIGEQIELLEEDILENPSPQTMAKIHQLKRELIYLRKSIWPLREVIGNLHREESPLIHRGTMLFLRDLHDHAIQVIDTIETYRDMLSGMIDIYMSGISNRMNEVMKVLTIIATLFIPLTFIAGVYGMNFEFMPELKWPWGYAFVWIIMILIGGGMVAYFRKKRWL